MQTRTYNPFTTIHTEGALLPADLLQRVLAVDPGLEGLSPADYHLPAGEKLNEAINRSWNRLQGSWATFRTSRERLVEGDAGTTLTRERWLLPLFQELSYGRLQTAKAVELDGKSYPISHRWGETPIHLVGCGIELDRRTAGAAGASRSSPHSLLQELLNRSPELLWGLASNGLRLRVLRDNARLTRQAFLEFDLESMFEGEVYSDFAVLWLVCHQSRVESREQRVENCWLEAWSKAAQEQGTRALDSLRQGVEGAISALGSGFLRVPANQKLRSDLRSGALGTHAYYRQLLRLVYRLIFLFVAEDRDLLFDPASSPQARQRYLRHYSLARLRRLAERSRGGRHADLYAALRLVTDILGGRKDSGVGKTGLGLPVLGGFLFSRQALRDLESAELDNESLLSAIRHLIFMEEGRTRRVVDYKNLGARELGSVYESLLELHPIINASAGTFELTSVSGSERKTTGSFFTPEELITVLLDSALNPVIEQALARAGSAVEKQIAALLDLKICDPACGSGHFLLAAARRLARRLAQLRTGEGEPAPEAMRAALREVIANCIYGVDINPMSVELCKVSLWMEALEPGKPLSFLDAHIQCGDSLVGVAPVLSGAEGPGLDISEIPDEAFNPAFGDDKATASALKKRNKRERTGQLGMRFEVTHLLTNMDDLARWLAERAAQVDAMPEDDSAQVQAKAKAFDDYHATREYLKNRLELDLWTAAFFWNIPKADAESMLAPTQQELIQLRSGGELDARLVEKVRELAERLNFFHWKLAFPNVFSGDASPYGDDATGSAPGFDCVLGNPPWEKIKLQEEEFFAARDSEIVAAPNKAARQNLIDALVQSNPMLSTAFKDAKHAADATSKFVRVSGRYPLTAIGDVNTYALFAEHFRSLLSKSGRAGVIVPTGIATDDSTKQFFGDLIENRSLASLFGFENEAFIFHAVHHAFKFCALTMTGSLVKVENPDFIFFARYFEDMRQPERRFQLSRTSIARINPNTKTMPIFRTRADALLNRRIYERVPVFENEQTEENSWRIRFLAMFHMSNDSNIFVTQAQIGYKPLYEAKLIYHYDSRYSTYENATQANLNAGILPQPVPEQKQNPDFSVLTRYWVEEAEIKNRIPKEWKYNWLFLYRRITSVVVERTVIVSVAPLYGAADPAMVLLPIQSNPSLMSCLLANLNSLPLDYFARQKIGGTDLRNHYFKQLPVMPPSAYTPADIDFIAPRVLELVYTAYDLRPFAEDMGYHGEPFRWDEVRRAQLRAELDAYYARLYGLTRDELRYILDPKEVHGEDFPGETFRVLKDKEIRHYGEYRTRRLVLEAWDRMESGIERIEEIVQPLQTVTELPIEIDVRKPLPDITWIPVNPDISGVAKKQLTPNYRQAVAVAWLLENFGNGQSIPSFKAQKYSYFLQRADLADTDINFREFARGPYSPQVTYHAGAYAKRKSYWDVRGRNIVHGRNINEAIGAAKRVLTNIEQAQRLLEQLAGLTDDDLGGLATVDFAGRAVFERGQAITPESIRAYFRSDWPEKVGDPWYTDENINRTIELLSELRFFKKSDTALMSLGKEPEFAPASVSQPMLSDFGLYKCVQCGKLVMGFEKERHVEEVHRGVQVEFKRIK